MDLNLIKDEEDYRDLYLKERIKCEQHRSNYEVLKTIVANIQINREIAENRLENITDDELVKQYIAENTPPAESRANVALSRSQSRIRSKYKEIRVPPEHDKNRSRNNTTESSVQTDSLTQTKDIKTEKEDRRRRERPITPVQRADAQTNILQDHSLPCSSLNQTKVADSMSTRKSYLNEPDAALKFWKYKYAELDNQLTEFQRFVYDQLKHMVPKSKKEDYTRIIVGLEHANSSLNSANASLIRNKSVLQQENETLRKELDEARLKLQEQTALYHSKTAKMDNVAIHSASLPMEPLLDECCKFSHSQLMTQINAAESKAIFYKKEMENVLANNNTLITEIETMKINHEETVGQMKGLMTYIYKQRNCETLSLHQKFEDICTIMNTQQIYAEEIEDFIRGRNDENQQKVAEIRKEVEVRVVQETNKRGIIEQILNDIISEKTKLEDQLSELISLMEYYKQESGKQKEFFDKFLGKFYEIVGGEVDIVGPGVESNGNTETPQSKSERTSERIREEKNLRRVIRRLMLWEKEYEDKSKRYTKRIKELEKRLTGEKLKYSDQSAILVKKNQVIRSLLKDAKKISKKARKARKLKLRKFFYPGVKSDLTARTTLTEGLVMPSYEIATVPQHQPADSNIQVIHEKHSYFENVLKSVATSTSSELDVAIRMETYSNQIDQIQINHQ